ncbi:MAG: hypothetical protein IIB02_03125 [Thaumarchaeota archaeon]|nr:hypothetical protein [Nitrososphaerota archaeon]
MYKFIGLAMLGVFAMMVIPGGNFDTLQSENVLYGMATIVKNDSQGNEVFQQSVHNQLTDAGEKYILEAVFADAITAKTDDLSIGTICVSLASVTPKAAGNETLSAQDFDGTDDLDEKNCKQSPNNNVAVSNSVATIGSLKFISETGNTANVNEDDTINSIGICQNISGDADYANCETGGILFAVVSVTATTLAAGETVDITYKFDLVSAET